MPTTKPPELRLLSDQPETEDRFLWEGLRSLSKRLAAEIPRLPPTSPVLVSGDWGSGKTTLLNMIRKQLDSDTDSRTPTIWFEAWRYEGESLLLPALMRTVWTAAEEAGHSPGQDLKHRVWNVAVAVATGIGPTLAGMLGGPAGVFFQALLKIRESEEKATGSQPAYLEDSTQELWTKFRELLADVWGTEKTPVVFIDDLDRCSPAGAVGLLDALRMLIGHAAAGPADGKGEALNCRFVVALDRTVLAEAVAQKFSNVSRYEGNRYLEKIFPLAFDLPRPEGTAVHRFVHLFLEKAKFHGADPDHLDTLSAALADPIFANPRLMKRCINRFYLVQHFERHGATGDSGSEVEEDVPDIEEKAKQELFLAKWIAASERWPKLRRLLDRHDDEYWGHIRSHLKESDVPLPDQDAAELLKERGVRTWLRQELLGGKETRLIDYRVANRQLSKWGL